MKIVINYDFFDKILDARENINILKVVRNNKKSYIYYYLPAFLTVNMLMNEDIKTALLALPMEYLTVVTLDLIEQKMAKKDNYKEKAIIKLKSLVSKLQDLGVETDYDLLLQSKLYERVNNLYLNENKLPEIMTSKYILVPSYNHSRDIKNTSILQEHIIGSSDYVLSIGTKAKEYKLVYSKI